MILRCHPARTMDRLEWRMAIRASTYICPPGGRLIMALRLSFATLEWIVLGDEPAAAVFGRAELLVWRVAGVVLFHGGLCRPRLPCSIAQEQEAKFWELRAAVRLARLHRDQARRTEACDLIAQVYGWLTEGFDAQDPSENINGRTGEET